LARGLARAGLARAGLARGLARARAAKWAGRLATGCRRLNGGRFASATHDVSTPFAVPRVMRSPWRALMMMRSGLPLLRR